MGCDGGDSYAAFRWMKFNEITDETCSIYQAIGHTNGQECSAMEFCRNCAPGEACTVPPQYRVYHVDEYGSVIGEEAMLQEVFQRGPIACGIDATPLHEYTGGILCDTTGSTKTDHLVSVVGWGEEDGQKYWLVRNSWGNYWGENGFFRICRGVNNLGLEQFCSWATPLDTWTD